MNEYKVKYIGPDSADLRTGQIYQAHDLADCANMIGVKDRSGEWYAYPRNMFETINRVGGGD